ncbi:MAG: 2-hydroxyacyl-CoA dehydratase family protein [Pseudomonadota bacterium]
MTMLDALRFHAKVDLLGKGVLRTQRWRDQQKLNKPWNHEHVGPPLHSSARLRELISRHYLIGQNAKPHRKVAWVTSGAPVEFLKALGYFLLYPENHGAVCGIRRVAVDLSSHAEQAGYSMDLCSYVRTDFGSLLSGMTPVGRLPRPDLLVCCTNICQTVLGWYRVLAHHFKVPLVLIDTPFLYRDAPEHAVEHVKRQIEEAIAVAERVAGQSLRPASLDKVSRLSRDACLLWMEILACGKHRPAPMTAFDQFIHLAPVVEMRGDQHTVDYYRGLLTELKQRMAAGIGAVRDEKHRLLWDNLPVWYRVRWLSELFAENGMALVASTYTNAWAELAPMMDPARPLESAAQVYLHPILNRGTGHKLKTLSTMVRDYSVDGVVLHSDRSCKPYSVGQIDQREKLREQCGVPVLLLEADHNDSRAFADEPASNRLKAFFELLEN